MTVRAAILILILAIGVCAAFAAGIREFNVPTLERLGNELTRASQRPDRGASDPVRKRARQTAIAAVKDRLFEVRYDYVVLDDPDGSGFLVYALALANTKRILQTGGHYRVTVSADGGSVERIDLLSGFTQQKLANEILIVSTQHSSDLPAETWIYTSHVYRVPVALGTKDRAFWIISNGKMQRRGSIDDSEPKKK